MGQQLCHVVTKTSCLSIHFGIESFATNGTDCGYTLWHDIHSHKQNEISPCPVILSGHSIPTQNCVNDLVNSFPKSQQKYSNFNTKWSLLLCDILRSKRNITGSSQGAHWQASHGRISSGTRLVQVTKGSSWEVSGYSCTPKRSADSWLYFMAWNPLQQTE